ncbi:MAG: alkaline phosphatase [Lactobacillales bacterium]|jgi:alkaline phosphatase|nr:alkaline phosphatase [Lactobacillales bacterium]
MRFLILLTFFLFSSVAMAENVILMVGDGMGFNHVKCTRSIWPLFMETALVKSSVATKSNSHDTTDSAAAATAYACGIKTNNKYLGISPDGKACRTIAEEMLDKGYFIGILSTDMKTGATPSAFYAHTKNRRDAAEIEKQLDVAREEMTIRLELTGVSMETEKLLKEADKADGDFFLMIEGSGIDTKSHKNDLPGMQKELLDFDAAVKKAVQFAQKNKRTTVIVLADHETGGLDKNCRFRSKGHTSADVPLYAFGSGASLFSKKMDNTDVYKLMKRLLEKK